MSKQETIDDIMPSAVATDDEIRRWNALPEAEKKRRYKLSLEQAAKYNAESTKPPRSMDEILTEARSLAKARRNG